MAESVQILLKSNCVDDFVGFEYINNKINIYYPMVLKLFSDGKKHEELDFEKDRDAIKILSAFMRSFRLAETEDKINDQSPNSSINKTKAIDYPIEAYDFIIKDYQRNGRYIEFENHHTLNGNGKIVWKKTFNQSPFYINKQTVYLDVVTKEKKIVSNIMNDIYLFCVYESIYKFGSWYYGMNCKLIPAKFKTLKPELRRHYTHALESKIAETFDDDELNRLKNMLMIVEGANESGGIQRMGLKSYHSVFEKLIKWGLDNVGSLDAYNPRAKWLSSDNEEDLSPLRIDALRIENNCAFILDAKFYQNSKPGSADINKQITYGENLFVNHDSINNPYHNYDKKNIYNIFMSPKSSDDMDDEFIEHSNQIAKGGWRNGNHSFENVHLYYINFNKLLWAWIKNNRKELADDFKTTFLRNINNHLI